MPSKSISQQRIMGMALAYKRGELSDEDVSVEVVDIANSMTEKQLKDFAETKHAGLPKKVEELVVRYIIRDVLSESLLTERFKKVVRNKKVKRKKVCRPGQKVVGGKCVKMSSGEKRNRKKAARKSRSKRRSKQSSSMRKRKKSMSKRKRRNL